MAQFDGCSCYTDLQLARALPKETFELYLSSRMRLAEQALSAKLEEESQAKLRAKVRPNDCSKRLVAWPSIVSICVCRLFFRLAPSECTHPV